MCNRSRFLYTAPVKQTQRPRACIQPIQAASGRAQNSIEQIRSSLSDSARVLDPIPIQSSSHWEETVLNLDTSVDALLLSSIPAYPTEIWNSHPEPLVKRNVPVWFWPLLDHDEPDFWRWAARDMLTALGVDVWLVKSVRQGKALARAVGLKRWLPSSRLVVFGTQNFPWNATAAGHLITEQLGTEIVVKPLDAFRDLYPDISDQQVNQVIHHRLGTRYQIRDVRQSDLEQAVRTYLAIRRVLETEQACGMGVNCFGDLIIEGGRDVPCLAQCLLREDGYIAACDGDYVAMMSMVLTTCFLDKTCMMSNMYPVSYVGALNDHFGDPLSPDPRRYDFGRWPNLTRLGHCGYVGVVSPEMAPTHCVALREWGGTWEIKRDGRGCGIDGELMVGETVTAVQLKFNGRELLLGRGRVAETTRHEGMPHCESTALIELDDLETFVRNISREHSVFVYGDHIMEFETLARVLDLEPIIC
jgi:hypothetical protein